MFTGIVESIGTVRSIIPEGGNVTYTIQSPISHELHIDQSVSHDGVCLTVTEVKDDMHTVTAVRETLQSSNIGQWQKDTKINLERCMLANGRFDGHIVQGHIDCVGEIVEITNENGSYRIQIKYPSEKGITVNKGSITVNGISLTIAKSDLDNFEVVIIPYTWENTNLSTISKGYMVNLEFDILGKYVQKMMKLNP